VNFYLSSLFVRTQLPHAVGAAYSLKMDKKDACAITYFGDGGTSEVDENSPATDQLLASTIIIHPS
jgi:2-oxoisovalerate dehydrogenase E1 component alpha subunit